MILDSKSIKYEIVDITEPGKEPVKEMMQEKSISKGGTVSDPTPRHALPPQLFYDDDYCGDYDQFDLANEIDTLEDFLKLPADQRTTPAVVAEPEAIVEDAAAATTETVDDGDNKENDADNNKEVWFFCFFVFGGVLFWVIGSF